MCNFYYCTTLLAVTLKVTVDQYECLKLGGSYGRSEEFKRSDEHSIRELETPRLKFLLRQKTSSVIISLKYALK